MIKLRLGYWCAVATLVVCGVSATGATDRQEQTTTVGMSATVDELVLPGPQLEVKPLADPDAPFVLRIIQAYPHGGSFRYTFEYYALEPGNFNLKDHLQPASGAEAVELPDYIVTVKPVLPPGQIEPNALEPAALPRVGGYRTWVTLAALVWLAAGFAILLAGRKRDPEHASAGEGEPRTLADRLRPAVEAAVAGKLSQAELAALERVLLAFWRNRLGLNEVPAAAAMRQVLAHPEGGHLLRQLETWLHRPATDEKVDVAELLAAYRDLPADVMSDLSPEVAPA